MDTTLTPTMTPAEAFARAREALDAHEALLPALAERVDPVFADTNGLIVALLRAQLAACEAIVAMTPEAEAAFAAGYTAGTLIQAVTAATQALSALPSLAATVTP